MASELQRGGWMLAGVGLAALGAFVLWEQFDPVSPGSTASPAIPADTNDVHSGQAGRGASLEASAVDASEEELPASSAKEAAPAAVEESERIRSRKPDMNWIEERYAAAQAEREAIREGAIRERRKLNVEERIDYWAVEARLIDEIGPEAYDRLLYDDGRKNRTRVHWVAPHSHAGRAGIENGDVIISYGGEPIFSPRSIRETNRLFPPGQQIVVEVYRNGQILKFTIASDQRDRGRSGIVNGMTLLPFAVEP